MTGSFLVSRSQTHVVTRLKGAGLTKTWRIALVGFECTECGQWVETTIILWQPLKNLAIVTAPVPKNYIINAKNKHYPKLTRTMSHFCGYAYIRLYFDRFSE